MANELAGKVAVITGGAKGLGAATAELFVEEGARLVIGDLDEAGAELAARLGGDCRFLRTDVADAAQLQALVDLAVEHFGHLDIMVNNAGRPSPIVRLLDDTLDQFDAVMHVNVLGVMRGTQMAARAMAKTGGGSIINTSSIAGTHPSFGLPIYRASKAAVVQFTKMAAIELGEHGVRVNCLVPGQIETGLIRQALANDIDEAKLDSYEAATRQIMFASQPLKRRGQPRDAANAALFLASERSAYVTGVVLPVDGGISAGDAVNHVEQFEDARKLLLD
jgi:NAD(P)-dependent dehydrogenase (short-subunit alcohol dehydrogenase family)